MIATIALALSAVFPNAAMSDSDETCTYDDLRREILEQAAEQGVDVDSLVFCYE